MKTKKFNKKLSLNKKTIANLNNGQLGNVKGGYIPSRFPCEPSLDTNCIECPTYLQTCETCETCETCATCATCQTCNGCTKFNCPPTETI